MTLISRRELLTGGSAAAILAAFPAQAVGQFTAFKQAVAEAAARDRDLAGFYGANGYAPVWTGQTELDRKRRHALVQALADAPLHGLPADRYGPERIGRLVETVRSERDLGRVEVELSRIYLQFARDVQTGVLTPSEVDRQIVRKVPLRDRGVLLADFVRSEPDTFMRDLPPGSVEYVGLLKEKLRHERAERRGGWGDRVRGKKLEPGDSGDRVVALRDRLIRMGYLRRSSTARYDGAVTRAVAAFQANHGLTADGVAGQATLNEINVDVEDRLSQILVAMERERWSNFEGGRGDRHVWVNLTDFHAKIYDYGKVTFKTRSVIGESIPEKRTPEFSDMMEYMEVNPDWTVPRSILGRDYLPKMKRNPNAARYLQIIDSRGRVVPRSAINFGAYTARNFPFTVRQPPGKKNALGTVKFMFPNPYAIYLHDTPSRYLFDREVRDYSSGCIRLNDPHEFAYVLLRRQMADPKPYFQNLVKSGRQTRVPLEQKIPVHLDYRTAFTEPGRGLQHRRDVYGRDARIWEALRSAGVSRWG